MTGPEVDPQTGQEAGDAAGRLARATIRTSHADPDAVAAALAPDNTDEMGTVVEVPGADADGSGDGSPDITDDADGVDGSPEGRRVRTTIERATAAGLRSTADDYLVNVDVADRTFRHATEHTNSP